MQEAGGGGLKSPKAHLLPVRDFTLIPGISSLALSEDKGGNFLLSLLSSCMSTGICMIDV
jgi:hypothetical protein